MPTSYTSLLGLALPVTGELSGTWGDTVNNYITQYVDAAVAGVQTISGSQTAVTLSVTNGSSLITAGSGATGSAQFQIINCTGNPAGLLTITAPASSRQYIIINGTSTAQSVKIVGTGPTTGVTLVSGEKAHVAWNGSDFVKIATQSGTGEFVTVDTTNLEVTNIKAKDGTAAATIADSTGAITVSTLLNVDNLRLDGNTLSSTDSNGNVVIAPNGTGDVQLDADTVRVGDSAAAVTLTSNGAGALTVTTGGAADLILNTNSGSTSGSITIGNGTNGNITVATNGTGDFYVDADTVRIGDSNANATITTNGTGDLILNTNSGTNSGSITIEDGVNGNIIIAPNGTGQVQISNAALDLTTIEVTNIRAKDGTASMTLADTTGIITLSATAGTANGVLYLNGSRAVTSGSALTFDGANFTFQSAISLLNNDGSGNKAVLTPFVYGGSGATGTLVLSSTYGNANQQRIRVGAGGTATVSFDIDSSERMRLNSTSLNIGGNFTSTTNTLQVTGNTAIGYTTAAPMTGLIVAGNVGIGTASPNRTGFDANATVATVYGPDRGFLELGSDTPINSDTLGGIDFVSSTTNKSYVRCLLDGSANGILSIGTNGSERARIDASGTLILRQSSNAANTSVSFNTTVQNALTLDSSGNLGLGVTPSAWSPTGTQSTAFELKDTGNSGKTSSLASAGGDLQLSNNAYYDGSGWKYVSATSHQAANYYQSAGTHVWRIAPSGTAGNAVSFTQAMTLYASGGLSVGNTTDPGVGNIGLTNGGKLQYSATAYISPEDNIAGARIVTPGVLNVATGGTAVRMTIDSSGNLGLGVTPAAWSGLTSLSIASTGSNISSASNDNLFITSGAYYNGTNWIYKQTSQAVSSYQQLSGIHRWNIAAAGTGGTSFTFTQAMTLDASGVLLVGATSRLTNESMRIGTNGVQNSLLVGNSSQNNAAFIGTFNDAAILSVNRNASTGVFVNTSNYASDIVLVGSSTNSYIAFETSSSANTTPTERARIDSSGNLGLGVTPSAWSIGRVLQFGNGASIVSYADNAYFNANAYFDSGWKYLGNAAAGRYEIVAGAHAWYRSTSAQVAGTDPVFSQAMTLDASGRLGIGETNPDGMVIVKNTLGSGVLARFIQNNASFNSDIYINHTSSANNFIVSRRSNGEAWLYQSGADPIAFYTNATERARITSGGYFKASNDGTYQNSTGSYHEIRQSTNTDTVYISNTHVTDPYGVGIAYINATPNGTGNNFLYCSDATANRLSVRSNGGIANYQANDVNLSDRREKTNFAPAKSYLDTICAIPVQTFNYIDQSEDDLGLTLGVVAQDVQAVAPELVTESNWGTKDDPKMRLSIYQTDLQYALMKCIQELKSELDSVKAELATLKGA